MEESTGRPGHGPRTSPYDRILRGRSGRGRGEAVGERRGHAQLRSAAASRLGLAIVKAVMVLHGGAVRVENGKNGETLFALKFPVRI